VTRVGVAVDVGGTKILSAASDVPEHPARVPTEVNGGQQALMWQIVRAVRYWRIRPGERVVIASPGHLDLDAGRVLEAANLPFRDYSIVARVAERTQCEVELIGDATAATVAELSRPDRARHRDGLYVTISTGIGMGAIRAGRLDWSVGNGENELGHIPIDHTPEAELCGCGRRGCLEAYGSGASIIRRYTAAVRGRGGADVLGGRHAPLTVSDVVAAGALGDQDASEVIDLALTHLSHALVRAVQDVGASIVVLGGGVMVHTGLFEPLRDRLGRLLGPEPVIERCALGGLSAIHGAAAVCERVEPVMTMLGGRWEQPA